LKTDFAGYSPIIHALINIQETRGDQPEQFKLMDLSDPECANDSDQTLKDFY